MFNWITFLVFCVTTTYTPGPNPILSMNYARLLGFKRTLPFVFGIFTGFTLLMIFVAFFMRTLQIYLPMITLILKILGVIYILYLAWKTVISKADFEKEVEVSGLFRKGFLLQFINPKVYFYGITAFTSFILPTFQKPLELLLFAILLALIAMGGNLLWSFFGTLFQKLFSKHEKFLRIIMGLLLLYVAIKIAL